MVKSRSVEGLMAGKGLGVTEILADEFKGSDLVEMDLSDNAKESHFTTSHLFTSLQSHRSVFKIDLSCRSWKMSSLLIIQQFLEKVALR